MTQLECVILWPLVPEKDLLEEVELKFCLNDFGSLQKEKRRVDQVLGKDVKEARG